MIIRDHQRPSEAIRGHPSRSPACNDGGHQRPSGAIRDAHLQHPRRATLVIQAPIHREEAKQADQLAQRAGTLGATSAAQEAARIRGHVRVPDEGGHQRSSEVIRGHQRSSEAIRGHQRPSEVIRGHQRPSEVIRGHQRSSEVCTCDGRSRRRASREPWRCLCVGEGAVVSTTTSSTLKCTQAHSSAIKCNHLARQRPHASPRARAGRV